MAAAVEPGAENAAFGSLGRGKGLWWKERAEVDTSTPFQSVKEAVDYFGGSGHWKPRQVKVLDSFSPEVCHNAEEKNIHIEGQTTAQLEKDLIVKERETLEVLNELELTKRTLMGLELELLQKSSMAIPQLPQKRADSTIVHSVSYSGEMYSRNRNPVGGTGAKPSPNLTLMELRRAKLNLNRTTSDLSGIRSDIEVLHNELHHERNLLEKTRESLLSNSVQVSSTEKVLNQTKLMLQILKDYSSASPLDISCKLHELRSETEQFKRRTGAYKSEVMQITVDIEERKARIRVVEARLHEAKKMEKTAKSAEAAALAEIKALINSEMFDSVSKNNSGEKLTEEEYGMLVQRGKEAEYLSRKKVEIAMTQLADAKISEFLISNQLEETMAQVKTSHKALDEALNRVEIANKRKLAVEEALRKWRLEHGQKRRSSVHSSSKFKNPYPGHHRRDSKMPNMDASSVTADSSKSSMNGAILTADRSKILLRPTLSIGQILSGKLIGPDEVETVSIECVNEKPKVSLGWMLSTRHGFSSRDSKEDNTSAHKCFQVKKNKAGFVGSFNLVLTNTKNKKKKRQSWAPK